MQSAVEAVCTQNIDLTAFPALLRFAQFEKLDDAVKWLKDFSEVRRQHCKPCVKARRKCILHNGSSVCCRPCFTLETKEECTHQTEMVQRDHSAAVSCHPYSEASEQGLTTVPDLFEWKSKRDHRKPKKALRNSISCGAEYVHDEKEDTDEGGRLSHVNADDAADHSDQVDNANATTTQPGVATEAKGTQRGGGVTPVTQSSAQVAPSVVARRKGRKVTKAATGLKISSRKETTDGDTAILKDIPSLLRHLVQSGDRTLQNSDDLLRLKRRRYQLSSDSESEDKDKRPRTDVPAAARQSDFTPHTGLHKNDVAGPSRPAVRKDAVAEPPRRAP
ncbi:hypothetical protein K466DRAFT_597272 [Polyporus arcularius HHB13444]|uniref:Uncharacterized protein n=1 Tax=Polyporus arcularius HHB13444 TaxID=1314778 RepID=A0A5C3PKF7_9APHY|nr:hypothetical protein K466DRAFT_597272 [Polyporus arcularius HHB13444]